MRPSTRCFCLVLPGTNQRNTPTTTSSIGFESKRDCSLQLHPCCCPVADRLHFSSSAQQIEARCSPITIHDKPKGFMAHLRSICLCRSWSDQSFLGASVKILHFYACAPTNYQDLSSAGLIEFSHAGPRSATPWGCAPGMSLRLTSLRRRPCSTDPFPPAWDSTFQPPICMLSSWKAWTFSQATGDNQPVHIWLVEKGSLMVSVPLPRLNTDSRQQICQRSFWYPLPKCCRTHWLFVTEKGKPFDGSHVGRALMQTRDLVCHSAIQNLGTYQA